MHAAKITVVRTETGQWQLRRDGLPCAIRGVGGYTHLERAAEFGATTIRTWSIAQLEAKVEGKSLLDRAQACGLTVVAGIRIGHQRQDHDYGDPVVLQKQREAVRTAVRKYRHHPALLVWGLGNEMELDGDPADLRIWRELEILSRIIKEEDPDHPVMTVIAGGGNAKIACIKAHYPSLDILGINSYGSAALVNTMLDDAGWAKAYMLTEFGPRGQWEVMLTPWGAPIEPRSCEKVVSYVSAHRSVLADQRGRCLGTFCFLWGQKQEATATWFGMFLPTGEKTPVVDAMAREFTGRWPAHRSPQIGSLKSELAYERVPAGRVFLATVDTADTEHDGLTYEWQVVAESTDRKSGGAPEAAPPVISGCIVGPSADRIAIRTPDQPGAYRLFIYVRDGHGGGCTENVAFFVQP